MPSSIASLSEGSVLVLLRLLVAVVLGGAIGWNRFRAGKPAGIGTHALVSLGAAAFTACGLMLDSAGASRVIQGVAAGIGFIGAGEIFRDSSEGRVLGLTSAAAIWASAAIGVLTARGSLLVATLATLLVLLVLVGAPALEKRFPAKKTER